MQNGVNNCQLSSQEYFAIFNVGYKLVIGFAAVGIINAVFIQETFKVASSDDTVMMRQKALLDTLGGIE